MTESTHSNYVAAWHDYTADRVVVLERDDQGCLSRKSWKPPYYFYVEDDHGEHESIFGHRLRRIEFDSRDEYDAARRQNVLKFESDISPLKRVLMDNYYGRVTPRVNYAFIDIEVDYRTQSWSGNHQVTTRQLVGGQPSTAAEEQISVSQLKSKRRLQDWQVWDQSTEQWVRADQSTYMYSGPTGFAGPGNPYAAISAVTIWQSWTGRAVTLAVAPPTWTADETATRQLFAQRLEELRAQGALRADVAPEFILCCDERALLSGMLDLTQDADIISGWNSEFFDLPYICERILVLGGQRLLQRLDWPGVRAPKKEMVNRFGSEEPIYKLSGRSHLDYMRLFQKFTFEGRTSYALGNILQEEVGIGKLEYDGTLEQLYNQDFILYALYNWRDVDGLVQLDEKFKFIALANQMAHENTVLFDAVLGTVSYVETGVANHAHNRLKKIVHDKVITENDRVEGAIVMTPKIGLHEWVGSVDINSLYPNTIRSLNISPEKIIGQFCERETAWAAIRDGSERRLSFVFENGSQEVATAAEWHAVLQERQWACSAYGTVFDQSAEPGVVPDILAFWYAERKRLQAEKKRWAARALEIRQGRALTISD